jgi:prolyl-tRNA synthetase
VGIPHRLVLGERGLDAGTIEYKGRQDADKQDVELATVINFLKEKSA